ncbi:UPAR/Ly6 domain-containing protein bou-like [Dermatophagoides pteronyssinus]|uniref:UPAR/Ly6 domain-containing protein bou-like n=1 Tax=Dermatophagoides pteronyssinus TaxID=6956 RepID=UPI003F669F90
MRLKLILLVLFLINLNDSAIAIKCFQCDSNIDLECSEYFDSDMTSLQSKSCDNVFEARFCIKTTGMFGGVIGTIRNCSSRDLGDRCSYLKRPGDQRYVRSCVYTCSSDDCNHAQKINHSLPLSITLIIFITSIFYL